MDNVSDNAARLWFRGFRAVPTPRLRLVCFAHAGGTASEFRSWYHGLPADVEVLGVRYPGRQDRLIEEPIDDIGVLADAIADAIQPLLVRPLAFFGHSMGASVAHEVAVRLRQRHGYDLRRLFVSARRPPHRLLPDDTYLRSDDDLVKEMHRLGDLDAELADDPEMRELILPALRADFKLVADYRPTATEAVGAPIDALIGTEDPDMSEQDMRDWSALTTSAFESRAFPGGHFYLRDSERALVEFVSGRVSY